MSLFRRSRRLLPGGNLPCEVVPVFSRSEQAGPRLRVYRVEPGLWWAQVIRPDGTGPGRAAPTHAQALAVGLAALEHATVAGSRP